MTFRHPRLVLGLLALWLLPQSSATASPAIDAPTPRVLLVVSSEGRDKGKTRPGFEMDEFAQAWLILKANGFAIDVASPAGGPVEADAYNAAEPFNAAVLADADATEQLAATLTTQDVVADAYAGALVIGGKGAMFDLPGDPALQQALARIWQRGGVIGAVCHGPAALVEVRLEDGRRLVEGRQMTGFTEEEETVFGKRWATQFPFQLEPALRAHGARWQEAPLMMPKVVVDGRLVTGQNPYSTAAMTEAFVRASGRQPVPRQAWRDERSMALAQAHLQDRGTAASSQLAGDPSAYHVELIGILGYYQLQAARSDQAIADALSIMQLAQPHMGEPRLDVAMAEAHWRLGDAPTARALLAKHAGLDQAKALLDRMQP